MQRADAPELLLTMHKEQGSVQFCHLLEMLEDTNLEQYLSTAETLMLLTRITNGRKGLGGRSLRHRKHCHSCRLVAYTTQHVTDCSACHVPRVVSGVLTCSATASSVWQGA